MTARGSAICELIAFRTLGLRLSGPDALAGFKSCKSFNTPGEVKWICGMDENRGTDGSDTKSVSLTNTD